MNTWERLAEVLDRYDGDFKADTASACAWAGTLRLTLTNPEGRPARSITFYATGGMDPENVARRCLDDADEWLAESEAEPMPVPDWMR